MSDIIKDNIRKLKHQSDLLNNDDLFYNKFEFEATLEQKIQKVEFENNFIWIDVVSLKSYKGRRLEVFDYLGLHVFLTAEGYIEDPTYTLKNYGRTYRCYVGGIRVEGRKPVYS